MKEYIVTEHPDFPYEEPKPQELIRCKDCEHYAGEGMYCAENILVPFDHFYCYYSVRKENDKTD